MARGPQAAHRDHLNGPRAIPEPSCPLGESPLAALNRRSGERGLASAAPEHDPAHGAISRGVNQPLAGPWFKLRDRVPPRHAQPWKLFPAPGLSFLSHHKDPALVFFLKLSSYQQHSSERGKGLSVVALVKQFGVKVSADLLQTIE